MFYHDSPGDQHLPLKEDVEWDEGTPQSCIQHMEISINVTFFKAKNYYLNFRQSVSFKDQSFSLLGFFKISWFQRGQDQSVHYLSIIYPVCLCAGPQLPRQIFSLSQITL